jgi:hypothetical protein
MEIVFEERFLTNIMQWKIYLLHGHLKQLRITKNFEIGSTELIYLLFIKFLLYFKFK